MSAFPPSGPRRLLLVLAALPMALAVLVHPADAAPSAGTVKGRIVDIDPRTGVVAVTVGGAPPNVVLVRAGEARVAGAASLDVVPDGWSFSADTTSETVEGIEVRTASAIRVSEPAPSGAAKPTTTTKPEEEGH